MGTAGGNRSTRLALIWPRWRIRPIGWGAAWWIESDTCSLAGARPVARRFEPPVPALGRLFRSRLDRIYPCAVDFTTDINTRPTHRVLGGYYKSRRLVRVYAVDRGAGRRPLEELFDTFLHEVAHHLEYTEPDRFEGRACGRVPGRMHSRLVLANPGRAQGPLGGSPAPGLSEIGRDQPS